MRTPDYRLAKLVQTALLELVLAVVNIGHPGNPVMKYLSESFGTALSELGHVLGGTGKTRQLFVSYGGHPAPMWERMLVTSSIVLIMLGLPFGLLCLWRRYRSNAFAVTFGVISLLYPLTQVFRFTTIGAQLVDRARFRHADLVIRKESKHPRSRPGDSGEDNHRHRRRVQRANLRTHPRGNRHDDANFLVHIWL